MSDIGLVGLGAMGWPIAQSLTSAGQSVRVYDINEASLRRAAADGIATAPSLSELATATEVVLISLPTPAVVATVVDELRAASPTLMLLDTSTNDPRTAQRLAGQMRQDGGDYADCPVLGRPERVGHWTIPVGGSPAAYELSRMVLSPLADDVVHVGEAGSASVIKVLNNLMLGTINAITAEVLVLAEAAGLDPGVFVDVVLDSGAASVSGLFKDVAPRAVDGRFEPTFSLRLMHKDNALALALADEAGVPLLVGRAAQTLNTMGLATGHGDEDSIAVVKALELITGRQARRRRHRSVHTTARATDGG